VRHHGCLNRPGIADPATPGSECQAETRHDDEIQTQEARYRQAQGDYRMILDSAAGVILVAAAIIVIVGLGLAIAVYDRYRDGTIILGVLIALAGVLTGAAVIYMRLAR